MRQKDREKTGRKRENEKVIRVKLKEGKCEWGQTLQPYLQTPKAAWGHIGVTVLHS